MKSIISINNKFMEISPKKLVELIKGSKYTKGVEIYVNIDSDFELKYLDDLVFELKNNDLILQIHGNIELEMNSQINYLKKIESYSDYLGYPITLTLHTIYDEDQKVSLEKTTNYMCELFEYIDSSKFIFCIENLNDIKDLDRLNKSDIEPLVLNDERIYFTYDMGHEIADYGSITDLDIYMIDEIRNVHIHTNDGINNDHIPIYRNDKNWDKIIKSLTFLIVNHYKYNIVYEYGLDFCSGNTVEEKIKDYLFSIDLVSEKYV